MSRKQKHLALEAIHDTVYYVDNEFRDSPAEVDVRTRIFQIACDRLEKIRKLGEKNPLGDRNEAITCQRYGDIYLAARKLEDAVRQYERTYEILKKLAREYPTAAVHQSNLAAAVNKLASVHWRRGNTFKARDYYQQGLQYRQRWAEMLPDRLDGKQAIAESYAFVGKMNLALGQPQAAFESYDKARQQWRTLPKEFLLKTNVYCGLANLQQRLGDTYYQLENPEEAQKLLNAALKKREKLLEKGRQEYLVLDLCLSRMALGNFYIFGRKDPNKAWSQYQLALQDFQQMWETKPELARTRIALAAIHYRLGATLLRAKEMEVKIDGVEHSAAQTHFQKSCKLREELAQIDPTDMQSKLEWSLVLARCGRAAQAESLANELADKGQGNPRLLSQAAYTLALCSDAADAALANRCRDGALKTLKKSIDAGWRDWVALRDDPDLDPIRGDPEFVRLQQDLKASATAEAAEPSTS